MAQALEFVRLVATTQTHIEATAREDVHGGDFFCHDQRMVQWQYDHG